MGMVVVTEFYPESGTTVEAEAAQPVPATSLRDKLQGNVAHMAVRVAHATAHQMRPTGPMNDVEPKEEAVLKVTGGVVVYGFAMFGLGCTCIECMQSESKCEESN